MKIKLQLAVGIFCIAVGVFMLFSGILWGSVFYIFWGVAIIGIGIWQLATSKTKGVPRDEE